METANDMRVLQIVNKPQRRGAEVFAFDLSRQFESLGLPVKTIYLYSFSGENRLDLHGKDICLEGSEGHFLERFLGIHPILLRRVAREIKRFDPDIVQVNGSRTVKYGAAAKQLNRYRKDWKLVYRNIGIASDWHRGEDTILAYRHMIMPKMDGVIGVSRMSLSDAKSLYRLEGPCEIIPNGVSPDRLATTQSREEIRRLKGVDSAPVLLFLGYLDRVKRPDRFLRVVAEVRRTIPDVRGWIVGEGPMMAELQRLARRLEIQDRIDFMGNQANVGPCLTASDLLLLTSDTEGLPATVLEAAYVGLPVIAMGVGGLAECIDDGETGILVPKDDEAAFVQSVLSLALDDERRERMARSARRKAREEFTIDKVAARYLQFYEQLVGKPQHDHV